jgi:hypothetical protein
VTDRRQQAARIIDRVYASLTASYGVFDILFGVFAFVMDHHGSGPVGMIFVIPGLVLAGCGVALWRGARWASPLAVMASLVPWVVPFVWYPTATQLHSPSATWGYAVRCVDLLEDFLRRQEQAQLHGRPSSVAHGSSFRS